MRHFTYLVLAMLCLSTIGLAVKLIGDAVPLMTIAFLRIFIAFVFLVIISLAFNRETFATPKNTLVEYAWIGLIMATTFALFIAANYFAPIQNAVLLSYTSPFFVLIPARFILKEKVTKTKIVAMLIAFAGLVVINPFSSGYVLGNSLSLMNAVFFALFLTFIRKEESKHDFTNVMWYMFFGSIALLPFALYYGFGDILSVWKELLLLGGMGTGLAYLLINIAMKEIKVEISSITSMILVPLFAIILAVVFLSEGINSRVIIGGIILITAGIILELMNDKRIRSHIKFLH